MDLQVQPALEQLVQPGQLVQAVPQDHRGQLVLLGLRVLLAHRDLRVLSGQLVLLVPLVQPGRVLREQPDPKGHKETQALGLLEQQDQLV